MIVKHPTVCGTTEKSDAVVRLLPLEAGREIVFQKIPHPRFIERETALIEQLLNVLDVGPVHVEIEDYGALSFVLEARLRTALILAGEEESSC